MLAKREVELGKANLTVDAKRNGIDIYKMNHKKEGGFEVLMVGVHPSEKVTQFTWSPAGEIFALCERESVSINAKNVWSFYMTMTSEVHTEQHVQIKEQKVEKGKINILNDKNIMGAVDSKFEFRKTARHEITDALCETAWDSLGRYVCIYGVKKPGPFDKEKRSVRIFSIMGQQLHQVEKLDQLSGFMWRPRPNSNLDKKSMQKLKKEFRDRYGKQYRDEERKDTTNQQNEDRERKATIINQFLNNFYLPQRQKYENDIEWYKTNWPIKEYEEKPATVNYIYAFGETTFTKKVEI